MWHIYAGLHISLKVIYHPLYGMNNYVLIWGDWGSCDPANHPIYGVIGYHVTLSEGHMITPYKKTLVPHLMATLIYLSQNYSFFIRGDRSPLPAKLYLFSLDAIHNLQ